MLEGSGSPRVFSGSKLRGFISWAGSISLSEAFCTRGSNRLLGVYYGADAIVVEVAAYDIIDDVGLYILV